MSLYILCTNYIEIYHYPKMFSLYTMYSYGSENAVISEIETPIYFLIRNI